MGKEQLHSWLLLSEFIADPKHSSIRLTDGVILHFTMIILKFENVQINIYNMTYSCHITDSKLYL